jgi:hypothetical protein
VVRELAVQTYLEKENVVDAECEILEMILEVFDTYIVHSSPTQVNLPSNIFKQIKEEVEEFKTKVETAVSKRDQLAAEEEAKIQESKSSVTRSQSIDADKLLQVNVGKKPHHRRDASDVTNSRGTTEDSLGTAPLAPGFTPAVEDLKDSSAMNTVNDLNQPQPTPSENDLDGNRKSGTLKKHRRLRSVGSAPESSPKVEDLIPAAVVAAVSQIEDDPEKKKSSMRLRRTKSGQQPSWGDFMAEQTFLKEHKSVDSHKSLDKSAESSENGGESPRQRLKSAELEAHGNRKKSVDDIAAFGRKKSTEIDIISLRKKSVEMEADKKTIDLNQIDLDDLTKPMTEEELADGVKTPKKHKRSRSKNISIGKWEISIGGAPEEKKKNKRTKSRQSILRQYVIVTIYDKALQEIFELMRADSFQRFKNTARYHRLIEKLKAISEHKQAMRDLKILA